MRKFKLLLLYLFLLQGNLVLAQESASSQKKSFTRKRAIDFYQKALDLGTEKVRMALTYADSLEETARALGDDELLYKAFKVKGDLYRQTGDYNQAFFWLQHALNHAKSSSDTLAIVRVQNNLGNVYKNTGALDKAIESYLNAFQLGDGFLDSGQKATVLSNIGMVYEELEQHKEALSYYVQALKLIDEKTHPENLALVHTNLGALYVKENNKEKALEHLKLARSYFEKLGNDTRLAEVLNEFGLVYLKDNPEISIEYLNLAEKLYTRNQNKAGLFEIYKNLGVANTSLGNYQQAFQHLRIAEQYSQDLQNDFLKGQVYLKLASLHEQQQKYQEATAYYNKYMALDQSHKRVEIVDNIARTQSNFELEQKDEKIRRLEEEAIITGSQLRKQYIFIGLLALLVLLGVGLAVWFALKFKSSRRLNDLLRSRNQLVQAQKAELKEQSELIASKKVELEEARKASEEYFQELYQVKGQLEEKVNKRTEELEETYRKLSFHINNTPLAVLEWNNRQELTYWPKQAETIFGYTAEEVLGLRIDEVPFFLPEDGKEIVGVVEELCKGNYTNQYSTKKNLTRYGDAIFVEWSYSVLLNSEGKLESILSIANDVTIREQNYRELQTANQELDTFLYKSSHDLRGPIARMQGIINLGLLESKDKEAQLYFNMLNKVTDELNHLLLRLLMVHSINQHDYQKESLSFAVFVDKLIATHTRQKVSFQEVEIRNKIRKDLVIVSDGTLLGILLVNLLENAMMFADNFNPVIEIDAEYLPSGKYIISVMDNGVGIPPEYQEKIFDMFFQGSTRSTGTGLGLYMVRKAVKKLGGDIKLISGKGQTMFEITLPALRTVEVPKVKVLN